MANTHLCDFCCGHLKLLASAQRTDRVPREDVVYPSSSGEGKHFGENGFLNCSPPTPPGFLAMILFLSTPGLATILSHALGKKLQPWALSL